MLKRQEAAAKAAGSPTPSNHNESASSNLLGASDSWGSGILSPDGKGNVHGSDGDYFDDDEFGGDETGIEVEMEVADISDDDGFF